MNIDNIKNEFPILSKQIRGKKLVYLDSAATSLKPNLVVDRLTQFYRFENSNVHRGAHYLADHATSEFESSRNKIKTLINANYNEEIVFTKGTTESINLVAESYCKTFLKENDEIILTEMEHHANIVPWQMLAKEKKLVIKIAAINESGELIEENFVKLLNEKTRFVAITHCSNTLGTINDVKKYIQLSHAAGAKVLVDGAQMVMGSKVNVQDLDCDFYVFSGHKMFGPFGVGILYGKKSILEIMPPYQGGGSMISSVSFMETKFNEVPYRFEAGTPAIAEVVGLGAAVDFINSIGIENIASHKKNMLRYAQLKLSEIDDLKVFGTSKNKTAITSFSLKSIHQQDAGQILDQNGIAVRVGHMCTQPLMNRLGINGVIRASFSIYNNEDDVDSLIEGLKKVKELCL